jgi:hypothetical protein
MYVNETYMAVVTRDMCSVNWCDMLMCQSIMLWKLRESDAALSLDRWAWVVYAPRSYSTVVLPSSTRNQRWQRWLGVPLSESYSAAFPGRGRRPVGLVILICCQ